MKICIRPSGAHPRSNDHRGAPLGGVGFSFHTSHRYSETDYITGRGRVVYTQARLKTGDG